MELILIDETKLKLILTERDVDTYGLQLLEDGGEETTRDGLERLLMDVKLQSGFETEGGRLLVQLYPDRLGGCEIFVTRVEEGAMEKGKKEKATPPKVLFSMETLGDVLTVAGQLHKRGYERRGELWHGEDGAWYLLLERERGEGDALAFVEEYGRRHTGGQDLIFFSEHATLILRDNTIPTLASLAT